MKAKTYKTVCIRIDAESYEKLRKIADAEGRFISRQVMYWVRQAIRAYEGEKE